MSTRDEITLLRVQKVKVRGVKHLEELLEYHRDQLARILKDLDKTGALASIQAISHNIVHLSREIEKRKRVPSLTVLPGGKKG